MNFYDDPTYNMVPHKDGYVDQAIIVSLGSHTALRFWHEPRSELELEAFKDLVSANLSSDVS